jgi:hypothetical protein
MLASGESRLPESLHFTEGDVDPWCCEGEKCRRAHRLVNLQFHFRVLALLPIIENAPNRQRVCVPARRHSIVGAGAIGKGDEVDDHLPPRPQGGESSTSCIRPPRA